MSTPCLQHTGGNCANCSPLPEYQVPSLAARARAGAGALLFVTPSVELSLVESVPEPAEAETSAHRLQLQLVNIYCLSEGQKRYPRLCTGGTKSYVKDTVKVELIAEMNFRAIHCWTRFRATVSDELVDNN
jgi:hypothetical protein